MSQETALNNYDAALKAEARRVTRCFNAFTSEQRANRAASFRLGHRQRHATGEYFYIHPAFPHTAFKTRRQAALAALSQ